MIRVIDYTKNPLSLMGEVAATCWDSTPSAEIGKECIESGHGRILEFADITVEIDGYSARTLRELYTHIVGTSRVQSSTRYIKYGEFKYYTPNSIKENPEALEAYDYAMGVMRESYRFLNTAVPKEDTANLLPLGMISKMVLKINVRALLHLSETRLCRRALKELRELVKELLVVSAVLDDEWSWIAKKANPICKIRGYCIEKHGCGLMPNRLN